MNSPPTKDRSAGSSSSQDITSPRASKSPQQQTTRTTSAPSANIAVKTTTPGS